MDSKRASGQKRRTKRIDRSKRAETMLTRLNQSHTEEEQTNLQAAHVLVVTEIGLRDEERKRESEKHCMEAKRCRG